MRKSGQMRHLGHTEVAAAGPARREMGRVATLLVVALVVRIVLAIGVQHQLDHVLHRQFLIPGDADGYWELGGKLIAGQTYALYDPPRYALRMPGFPAVLAFSRGLFGPHLLPARFCLACIGTLGVYWVYLLGRELAGPAVGLAAGWMVTLSPLLAGFSILILSESTFAVMMTGSLLVFARLVKLLSQNDEPHSQSKVLACWLGVSIAAATYVRPTWILAGPAMAVVLVTYFRRNGIWPVIFMLIALAACMFPWTIRNGIVTGHYTPTTLWVGPSLYDGLRPGATGDSDMQFFETDRLLATCSEYEVDRIYRQRAWDFAKAHPGEALRLALAKFQRTWNPFLNASQFRSVGLQAAISAAFFVLVTSALVGAWVHRGSGWLLLIAITPVAYFTAIHMVFVGSVRYRLPGEYPLMVLAAAGLLHLWQSCRPWQAVPSGRASPVLTTESPAEEEPPCASSSRG